MRRLGHVGRGGHTVRMDYWQGPSRWINAALLFIVGFVAFDAVFTLLGAQDSNPIVGLVGAVAGVFEAPFAGMFPNQPDIATQALAIVGWILMATIVLAVVRGIETGRREHARDRAGLGARDDGDAPTARTRAPGGDRGAKR